MEPVGHVLQCGNGCENWMGDNKQLTAALNRCQVYIPQQG